MTNSLGSALHRPLQVDSQSRIIWPYIIGIGLFHLLIPLAFLSYVFSWWGVVWLPVGNYIFCSMGIGAGYHRLLTHRGFKCPLWLEHGLAILGVCNLQDSPARWVVVHRMHHQHSDHQPDPHTPQVSWFWGHVGWLFIENRETTSAETYHKYAGDILSDRFYMRLERNAEYFWVYVIQAVLFYAVGLAVGYLVHGTAAGSLQFGVQWLLWGVIYRTLLHVARDVGRKLGRALVGLPQLRNPREQPQQLADRPRHERRRLAQQPPRRPALRRPRPSLVGTRCHLPHDLPVGTTGPGLGRRAAERIAAQSPQKSRPQRAKD